MILLVIFALAMTSLVSLYWGYCKLSINYDSLEGGALALLRQRDGLAQMVLLLAALSAELLKYCDECEKHDNLLREENETLKGRCAELKEQNDELDEQNDELTEQVAMLTLQYHDLAAQLSLMQEVVKSASAEEGSDDLVDVPDDLVFRVVLPGGVLAFKEETDSNGNKCVAVIFDGMYRPTERLAETLHCLSRGEVHFRMTGEMTATIGYANQTMGRFSVPELARELIAALMALN